VGCCERWGGSRGVAGGPAVGAIRAEFEQLQQRLASFSCGRRSRPRLLAGTDAPRIPRAAEHVVRQSAGPGALISAGAKRSAPPQQPFSGAVREQAYYRYTSARLAVLLLKVRNFFLLGGKWGGSRKPAGGGGRRSAKPAAKGKSAEKQGD
jgi:hypothetical protein